MGATGATGAQGIQGLTGATGSAGAAGTNGKTVLNGTTTPSAGTGTDGDFYINTATNTLFGPKASGAWPAEVALVGPAGATGATGATGAAGTQGIQGLTGATGAAGTQGATGATGPQGAAGANGTNSKGVPTGGTANQVLSKIDGTNYNTQWVTPSGGSADNLGNHTATQNLNLGDFDITNVHQLNTNRFRFLGNPNVHEFTASNVHNWGTTTANAISSNIPLSHTGHTIVRFSCSKTININGYPAGEDGQLLLIQNTWVTPTQNLNIVERSSYSGQPADGTRFYSSTGSSVNMIGQGFALCIYQTAAINGEGAWVILASGN